VSPYSSCRGGRSRGCRTGRRLARRPLLRPPQVADDADAFAGRGVFDGDPAGRTARTSPMAGPYGRATVPPARPRKSRRSRCVAWHRRPGRRRARPPRGARLFPVEVAQGHDGPQVGQVHTVGAAVVDVPRQRAEALPEGGGSAGPADGRRPVSAVPDLRTVPGRLEPGVCTRALQLRHPVGTRAPAAGSVGAENPVSSCDRTYSWMTPPSRSRRCGRMVVTGPCGAGVISAEPVRIGEDHPCRVALAARSSPTVGGSRFTDEEQPHE
jgi:hypothetical protein